MGLWAMGYAYWLITIDYASLASLKVIASIAFMLIPQHVHTCQQPTAHS
jgi:hypothetical protein